MRTSLPKAIPLSLVAAADQVEPADQAAEVEPVDRVAVEDPAEVEAAAVEGGIMAPTPALREAAEEAEGAVDEAGTVRREVPGDVVAMAVSVDPEEQAAAPSKS